jgi:hypothetical protein
MTRWAVAGGKDFGSFAPQRALTAGATDRSVLVDGSAKDQDESDQRGQTRHKTHRMRNERLFGALGKRVKLESIQDDRRIGQNDQSSSDEEDESDTAPKLVQLGNKLDRGHAFARRGNRPISYVPSLLPDLSVGLTMTGFPGKGT